MTRLQTVLAATGGLLMMAGGCALDRWAPRAGLFDLVLFCIGLYAFFKGAFGPCKDSSS